MKDRLVWRSRWAAVGAAVAVSLGGGGLFLANAAPGPAESTIVNVTPTRVLDTRDPVNLGLPGPFTSPTSQKLQITGNVPTSGGNAVVVPVGATGVLLNVTAVSPQAAGFVSIRPGNAVGAPTTSSLNVEANSNIPNAVQVSLPTSGADAGKIDITYDAYGIAGRTTELLVDIVGYTTNTGLQQLVADVQANRAVFFNSASGPTLANVSDTAIVSMSMTNAQRCILMMNGTTDWDDNSTNGVLFLQWNVDGADVGGSFADEDDVAGASNDSLTAIASAVINPGTHSIRLLADTINTADLEDIGATAQCVPFDGTGAPADEAQPDAAPPAEDDPSDLTD